LARGQSRTAAFGLAAAALVSAAGPVFGQIPGFDMVTVGAPGNPGRTITGPLGKPETIGSVGYEYRIARAPNWPRAIGSAS
jgi:hypothetical protein